MKRAIDRSETRIKGKLVAQTPLPQRIALTGSAAKVEKELRQSVAEFKKTRTSSKNS